MEIVVSGMIWYLVVVLSTVLHEAAHAFAALKLGDPTAYHGGQVTLDPMPHIQREPFGMVLVPWLSYFLTGWMMCWASCPYDPYWGQKHPKKAALMALAGPLSNLALAVIAGIALKICIQSGIIMKPGSFDNLAKIFVATTEGDILAECLAMGLSIIFFLNLLLFCFNLIPLPPLDGSGVIQLFMDDQTARKFQQTMGDPYFSMFGLLIAWQLFGTIFAPVWFFTYSLF